MITITLSMSGNTVYCYPDTQLLVYRACQLCHALLASLGLAPPGHMVSVSRLKLAFVLIIILLQCLLTLLLALIMCVII